MTRFAIPDFQLANPIYQGARVTIYGIDSDGEIDDDNIITLYDTLAGSDTLRNPQTLDSEGKFNVPVYVDEPCICFVSGLSVPDHQTGIIRGILTGSPSLRATVVRPTSDVVNPSSPYTVVCATVIRDDENNADGTGITIQSGQSSGVLRARASFLNIVAGSAVSVTIYKNGSAAYNGVGKAASDSTIVSNPTLLAETSIQTLTEGDVWRMVVTSDDASFSVDASDCWLELEIKE